MGCYSPGPSSHEGGWSHGVSHWGLYTWGPQGQGYHTLSPDTLTSPFRDCLPVPLHPAPTLRAETVTRSMSGELAMILWAARMPEGNRDPSSRPVLASPLPHSQEGKWKSHHPATPVPPLTSQGRPFPQDSNRVSFPDPNLHRHPPPPPAGRRVTAHPSAHSTPSRLQGLPAAVKPLAKAKASWPAPIKPTLMLSEDPPTALTAGAGAARATAGRDGAGSRARSWAGSARPGHSAAGPAPTSSLPPPSQPVQLSPVPPASSDVGLLQAPCPV